MDQTPDLEVVWTADELEELARAFHDQYRESQQREKAADDPSMRPWELLAETLRNSNRDLAGDVPRKLKAIGCGVGRGTSSEPFHFSPAEVEVLAAAEHERWNHERWAAGWTLGPKDVAKRQSPYLVHYHQLEERIKEYDRNAVRAIPAVLARIGCQVIRSDRPRVFVIRSFRTHGLKIILESAIETSLDTYRWDVPAITDRTPLDEIFQDVRARLYAAHHVLACVDEPNGNVGFEIGHALGRGARLALFHVHGAVPPTWLNRSPFEAYGVTRVATDDRLLEILTNEADAPRRIPAAPRGDKLTLLAPREGPSAVAAKAVERDARSRGIATLLVQEPEWNWRDAPVCLAGTGRVAMFYEPPGVEGDGVANTVNAAIAGYLGAYSERLPLVLQECGTPRRLVDFGGLIREYSGIEEARQIVRRELG